MATATEYITIIKNIENAKIIFIKPIVFSPNTIIGNKEKVRINRIKSNNDCILSTKELSLANVIVTQIIPLIENKAKIIFTIFLISWLRNGAFVKI
ncbi:hypothetical protein [Desulfitobacterium sp. AusDCA]|uniref:hypothetical protein n=1 Tax=Desulfitobacterium sp. AusDCA TaxID=3240383 RepID=UPI003DA7598F